MTVNEAIEFFSDEKLQRNEGDFDNCRIIVNRLKPLQDVGLGYIKLGQNSSSLSGGENQRVKLAFFIGKEEQEPTLSSSTSLPRVFTSTTSSACSMPSMP